tara:strand:+ start:940 stop:1515 length:576 start_codon:yes stop_codon:yes gene_type:complete
MPSDLQVSNIRDLNNANSAISIASDGQVTIAQNNPTIQLGSNTTFPAGHVLQTISDEYSTETSVTNDNFEIINSSFKVDITPASSSNKILVMFSNPTYSGGANQTMGVTIFRSISGGTQNVNIGASTWGFAVTTSSGGSVASGTNAVFLDSPNVQNVVVTYQLAHKEGASGTGYSCVNSSKATITCMEIKQ